MNAPCPHCSAANSAAAKFCTTCGKAMPSGAPAGPRVLMQADLAASSAGQSLQLNELRKQARRAVRTMGWLAGIQITIAAILVGASQAAAPDTRPAMLTMGAVVGFIGLIFTALAFWARKSPLPASITGLVLFVSLWALDVALTLMGEHPEQAFRGLLIRVLIVGAMGHAVSSAVKHKTLLRKMAADQPADYRAAA